MNEMKWCSIWGNAVSIAENRPEGYAKDITLRYPVTSSFDGSELKITFDNFTGTEPVTITAACIYAGDSFHGLSFSGKEDCTIEPGCDLVSDPLPVTIHKGDRFEVCFYLKDFTRMRAAVYVQGPFSGGRYVIGNALHDKEPSIDLSRKTNIVYFLSNVSLLTSKENRTILCYGDSITAQDWPDDLLARCFAEGFDHTAIIRKATSGSRILRQYSCITYESYGLMSRIRFPHELPSAEGVDTVILQQGINDIIHPVGTDVNPFRPMSDLPTADELIRGFTWYIEEARKAGLKVYAGTLLPIRGWRTYAPFREDLKNAFNDFLRTTDLTDGCIDFEAAVRDPADPPAFLKEYDSGDHLHPSTLGYQKMAETVPKDILW